jgi:disulfide bond formation protein DsbB
MLSTQKSTATFISLALLAILIGAFIFQYAGYMPCDLCYKQRWAYYVGIPFAGFMAMAKPSWMKQGMFILALMLAANAIFGAYHSGVEWGWWEGPSTCAGGGALTTEPGNLLESLKNPGVMCTEAAIRILGLSLAGWNAIICAILAALAFRSLGYGSSSVSQ